MEKDKPVLRNKSIGTKVSEEEYAQLEKLAEGRVAQPSKLFFLKPNRMWVPHPLRCSKGAHFADASGGT